MEVLVVRLVVVVVAVGVLIICSSCCSSGICSRISCISCRSCSSWVIFLRICLAAGSGDWRLNAGVRGASFEFQLGFQVGFSIWHCQCHPSVAPFRKSKCLSSHRKRGCRFSGKTSVPTSGRTMRCKEMLSGRKTLQGWGRTDRVF